MRPGIGSLLRSMPLVVGILAAGCTVVRTSPDSDLATYIDTLTAIDSHAHPMA